MSNLVCLLGHEIPLRYFLKISEVDEAVFPSTYCMPLFKGLFWVKKSYDGYVIVYDKKKKKVAGYVSFISIEDSYYQKMKEGKFVDVTLPIKALKPFSKKSVHHLYCSSVAVLPEYREEETFNLLIKGTFQLLQNWAKAGIYADKILADAVSEEGKKLCFHYGLTPIGPGQHNSLVYEGSLIPMSCRFPGEEGKRLMALYQNKASSKNQNR